MSPAPSGVTLLSISGLAKSYDGARALSDVRLDLRPREIHALMGENGAGKSTLIRILAGVTAPDGGTVLQNGLPLALGHPGVAERSGFRFIHQELNIVPTLSVAENILLGHALPRRFGCAVDWRAVNALAAAALARFGVTGIDPRTRAGRLTVGDRMLIRLASMLVAGGAPPCLFVLDEPTAALTQPEADRLFRVLDRLRRDGAAILFVSHRIEDVMAIADRVTVLRDGRSVMSARVTEIGREALVAAMTGQSAAASAPPVPGPVMGRTMLAMTGVSTRELTGIDLSLREGEVLGIAGLEDAGQSALLRLLLGEGRTTRGSVTLDGRPGPRSPAEAWSRGMGYVPRERRTDGLMLRRGIVPNVVLPHLRSLPGAGLVRPAAERGMARALAGRVGLRFSRLAQPVGTLSGGNQQKVLFARAMGSRPKLLLLDDPTRGVDVGARAEIHALIRAMTAGGAAAIVASTDLPELIALSDRILILHRGAQRAILPAAGLTAEALLSRIYAAAGEGQAA